MAYHTANHQAYSMALGKSVARSFETTTVFTPNFESPCVRGFTLIELVCIIVIIGMLCAVALPKSIDLPTEASLAAFKSHIGDARTTSALVLSKAIVIGPGGRQMDAGCTSQLDEKGDGNVCLGSLSVTVAANNMTCWSGMNQATYFKGPYHEDQNSDVSYHPDGDSAGGRNYWTHWASGCSFTCTTGTGPENPTAIDISGADDCNV